MAKRPLRQSTMATNTAGSTSATAHQLSISDSSPGFRSAVARAARIQCKCPQHAGQFRDESDGNPPGAVQMMTGHDRAKGSREKLAYATFCKPRAQQVVIRPNRVCG